MSIRYWLSVAPRDRVLREVTGGIVQAYYGARAVLAEARESDGIVCYSPRETSGGEPLRQFTAIGWIADAALGPVVDSDTGPLRRRVDYRIDSIPTPIRPLLNALEFTSRQPRWGYQLRLGILELNKHDFSLIRRQMRPPEL